MVPAKFLQRDELRVLLRGDGIVIERNGQTEINQLHVALSIQHDIVEFDIVVYYAECMNGMDGKNLSPRSRMVVKGDGVVTPTSWAT